MSDDEPLVVGNNHVQAQTTGAQLLSEILGRLGTQGQWGADWNNTGPAPRNTNYTGLTFALNPNWANDLASLGRAPGNLFLNLLTALIGSHDPLAAIGGPPPSSDGDGADSEGSGDEALDSSPGTDAAEEFTKSRRRR